tara:strand:- start:734 stop:1042 length:309 start_codon:yes stop_codon:yes gene_type:complete
MTKKTKTKQFTEDELKNSKRIYKSATPKYTVDWYIKWVASIFIVSAMSLRGIEGFQFYDLILSIIGVSGWIVVSILWKDRALIMLNSVGLLFLMRNFFAYVS